VFEYQLPFCQTCPLALHPRQLFCELVLLFFGLHLDPKNPLKIFFASLCRWAHVLYSNKWSSTFLLHTLFLVSWYLLSYPCQLQTPSPTIVHAIPNHLQGGHGWILGGWTTMARHLYPGLCYFVTPLLSLLWVGTLLEAIQAIIFTLSFGNLSALRAAINSLLS
jgi:hypothetical protein